MKAALAALFLLCLSVVAAAQKTPAEIQAMLKDIQRRTDSMMNTPKIKEMYRQGLSVNTDSLTRAAKARTGGGIPGAMALAGGGGLRPDTNVAKLPPKDTHTLGALPSGTLSSEALKQYAEALDKKLTPAFRQAFGTMLSNTDKYDPTTLSNASAIATEMGMLDQAVLLSLKSVERAPDDPAVLNNAGVTLHKGGLEIAAIPLLEAAAKGDPGNSTVENNLGQSYLTLGDREKASQHFQTCISAAPYHPLANSSLALIELEKGSRQSALAHVENSLRGAFTDKAWHLLYKLKKDPVLMDYFKDRYKEPEYFNENKYHLPFQCEKVADIPIFRAEYEAYHHMLDRVKRQFDDEARQEGEQGKQELLQKVKSFRPGDAISKYQAPFMELANAMLLDLDRQMTKDDADRISRAQNTYHSRIQQLQDEYKNRSHDVHECGGQIGLANEYMEKMAIETRTYQKVYLRIYKDFYHDNAYWTFFDNNNAHMRRASFCRLTSGLLSVLQQLAETHFLDVTQDCSTDEKEEKEAADIEIEANCPLGKDGVEIPFGIGKYNLSCEETEFQIGEVLILNVKRKFSTGETTWFLGPGFGVSILGHSHESLKKIPAMGPIKPGLEAGIKGQVFLTFRDGALQDWGGRFIEELDVLGWGRELSSGYTIGSNSGLNLDPGMLKDFIDDKFGPPKEVQQNKNIKIYNPR
jgi:tetratricopeptide (TPR) repeat protein